MDNLLNIAVLGASGYIGADAVRLALAHPRLRIAALAADTKAGKSYGEIYPHLGWQALPDLVRAEQIDWSKIDVVFGCLPHGASEEILSHLPRHLILLDHSADFRLKDAGVYSEWYGRPHSSSALLGEAVYGLTEWNRHALVEARIIACPGCYPTAVLLALLPGMSLGLVSSEDIIIDAKSGVSGAGRALKEANLFCEIGESLHPYGIGRHRHMPEIEQELAKVAGREVRVNFSPHLVPMSRGELVTCHVRLASGATAVDLKQAIVDRYRDEPFVHVLDGGEPPSTRHVRGSNHCVINVFADRLPGRAIVIAAIDNLVKGSAGQAIQNLNVRMGWDEGLGLSQPAMFP